MVLWQVLAMSVVEGITEFLPVSSTGHLVMASKLMGIEQTEFVKSFEVAIQLGAIMAVVILYAERLIKNTEEIKKVMVAFLPTAVLGFAGYKLIKTFLLGNDLLTAVMLFLGGVAILMLDAKISGRSSGKKIAGMSFRQAAILGVVQSLAVVPGVSRALVTIWGGMYLGLSKKEAVEMSFVLAIPTMAAAVGYDLLKSGWQFTGTEWGQLGIGFAASMLVAIVAVRWFLKLIQKKGMEGFGWYRIVAAAVFLWIAG